MKKTKVPPARVAPENVAAPQRQPLVFKVNIIVPDSTGSRSIAAGMPTPFKTIAEVPESLRPFVGEPPGPSFDQRGWAEETAMIEADERITPDIQLALDERDRVRYSKCNIALA